MKNGTKAVVIGIETCALLFAIYYPVSWAKAPSKETKPIPEVGGAILRDPVSVHLFWGMYWGTDAGRADARVIDGFAANVGGTEWFQAVAQYGDKDGPLRNHALEWISAEMRASEPKSHVNDHDIEQLIEDQINSGVVPWRDSGIYFVFTPPGVIVHSGEGATCQTICSYHGSYTGPILGQIRTIRYSVVPYLECEKECGIRGINVITPSMDQIIMAMSHEFAEATTDPDLNAWTGNKSGTDEIADRCTTGFEAHWGEYRMAVQDVWSNRDSRCVHGDPATAR